MSECHGTATADIARWSLWRPARFDNASTAPVIEPEEDANGQHQAHPTPGPSLEEIESAARERGYADGRAEGYAQGLEKGREEGLRTGQAEGYKEGYQAGRQAGLEAGADTAAEQARRLQGLADACGTALQNLDAETGHALTSLALRIAEQVVRSTLASQAELITGLVRDILDLDPARQGLLRLRVHSDDAELLQPYLSQDTRIASWQLVPDDTMERGGCIAETALGSIDATLETRWQRVLSALGRTLPGEEG